MPRLTYRSSVFVGLTLLFFFGTLTITRAESVIYQTNIASPLLNMKGNLGSTGGQCSPVLYNGHASVTYNVSATDAATGVNVCGTTVPLGAKIKFTFKPHVPQDVVWSGSGGNYDTPYGSWSTNATNPGACIDSNRVSTFGICPTPNHMYVALSVAPPDHSMTGLEGFNCGTPAADGSVTCTASQKGSKNPTFNFTPTISRFYVSVYWGDPVCFNSSWMSRPTCVSYGNPLVSPDAKTPGGRVYSWSNQSGSGWTEDCGPAEPYDLGIPAESIACPIIIESDEEGSAPAAPTISAQGQCVVGTPHNLVFSSTDPDGDNIRYGIDWDADSTADQFVPPGGFVPSGTSQTAARTYVLTGSKTVRVLAVDENGLSSAWSTYTFTCDESPIIPDEDADDLSGDTDDSTNNANNNGNSNDSALSNNSDTTGFNSGNGSSQNQDGAQVPITPNLSIRARPSLVVQGETTSLHWKATNVVSCTVIGNGDEFSGIASDEDAGKTSSAIFQQVIYTLRCVTASDKVLTQPTTINILPNFREI